MNEGKQENNEEWVGGIVLNENENQPIDGREDKKTGSISLTRRDFLRLVGAGVGSYLGTKVIIDLLDRGVKELNEWRVKGNLAESENNWMFHQGRLLQRMRVYVSAIELLNEKVYQSHQGKEAVKNSIEIISEIQNNPNYRKILAFLNEWLDGFEKENTKKGVEKDPLLAVDLSVALLKFLENVKYKDEIQEKYGVRIWIRFEDLPKADFKGFYKKLGMIPDFVIKQCKTQDYRIFDLDESTLGSYRDSEIYLDPGLETYASLHELTHAKHDEQKKEIPDSDEAWKNNTLKHFLKYSSDLWYKNSFQKWLFKKVLTLPEIKDEDIRGFARLYGKEIGLEDDIATMSDQLFDENSIGDMIYRAKEDSALKFKLELITGYHLDSLNCYFIKRKLSKTEKEILALAAERVYSTGKYDNSINIEWNLANLEKARTDPELKILIQNAYDCAIEELPLFGTPISEEEYKKMGVKGPLYWRKWSTKNGKVYMNADYYNKIAQGKPIIFNENSSTMEA